MIQAKIQDVPENSKVEFKTLDSKDIKDLEEGILKLVIKNHKEGLFWVTVNLEVELSVFRPLGEE